MRTPLLRNNNTVDGCRDTLPDVLEGKTLCMQKGIEDILKILNYFLTKVVYVRYEYTLHIRPSTMGPVHSASSSGRLTGETRSTKH